MVNRTTTNRRGTISARDIATQILETIKEQLPHLLKSYSSFLGGIQELSVFDIPEQGVAQKYMDMFYATGAVRFARGARTVDIVPTKNPEQAKLICTLANSGLRGLTRIPLFPEECRRIRVNFETFVISRSEAVKRLVEERTVDPDLQDKVANLVLERLDAAA